MSQLQRISTEPEYEVVWPLGKTGVAAVELAPAISDLNGKTVCEMWNSGFRGDQIYNALNTELKKKFPDIRILDHTTLGNFYDNEGGVAGDYLAKLPELLKQHDVDAVIVANGA